MNKVSLLAASVAIALTGCGGSDGGSNSANNGVVITALTATSNMQLFLKIRTTTANGTLKKHSLV